MTTAETITRKAVYDQLVLAIVRYATRNGRRGTANMLVDLACLLEDDDTIISQTVLEMQTELHNVLAS